MMGGVIVNDEDGTEIGIVAARMPEVEPAAAHPHGEHQTQAAGQPAMPRDAKRHPFVTLAADLETCQRA
jgi:hypothetical protein